METLFSNFLHDVQYGSGFEVALLLNNELLDPGEEFNLMDMMVYAKR